MKIAYKFCILMSILGMGVISCHDDDNVAVTGIRLSQIGHVGLVIDHKLMLTATVEPANATQKGVKWSSSDPRIAIVTDGVVYGVLPGTATISATTVDGDKEASLTVTITIPVESIMITDRDMELAVGEKVVPAFDFAPFNPFNIAVTWTSSNPDVLAVNPTTGELTGMADGTSTITVTSLENSSVTDNCLVKVTWIAVENIALSQKETELPVSEKATLKFVTTPPKADQRVKWSTSDPSIISIDPVTGEMTALAAGIVIITVTSVDNVHYDECIVTVQYPNLLKNPSFEEPLTNVTTLQDWTSIPEAWFTEYYKDDIQGPHLSYASNSTNRQGGLAAPDFFITGNGSFFASALKGIYGVRNTPGNTSGTFQIVEVTPGVKYRYGASVGFRRNSNTLGQAFRDFETIKILSPDGFTTYSEVIIPGNPNLSLPTISGNPTQVLPDVTGEFTVPEGVTEVRFQLDFRTFAGRERPLTIFDNCQFRMITD